MAKFNNVKLQLLLYQPNNIKYKATEQQKTIVLVNRELYYKRSKMSILFSAGRKWKLMLIQEWEFDSTPPPTLFIF